MDDWDDVESDAEARGRRAVWVHVLLAPYFLFAWFLAGVLPASSGATGAEGMALAPWIAFMIAIWALGIAFWVTLLRNLKRRRREGRYVSWLLPVLWAMCNIFTIFFAIAYFALAYGVPALRRRLG